MIKIIIGIWLLGAIFFTPFHYYSGAYDIRPDMQTNYGKGKVFGEAMRWPFYLFMSDLTTGESSIDGTDEKTFNQSLILIANERTEWGDKNAGLVLIDSLGQCVLREFYLNKTIDKPLDSKDLHEITNALYTLQDSELVDENTLQVVRKKIMEEFDGYDFSDIINEGVDCREENML